MAYNTHSCRSSYGCPPHHAKSLSKVKSTVAPLARKDGSLTTDPKEKAEILQNQYVKVFSDPSDVDPEKAVEHITEEEAEISDISFTKEDIDIHKHS
eukprot:sb/3479068/